MMLRSTRSVMPVALWAMALSMVPGTDALAAPRAQPPGISAGEAARLRHQHQEYRHLQRRAWFDGEVSRREQARLAREAAQLRHLIQVARDN